jgi:hypothetical protein
VTPRITNKFGLPQPLVNAVTYSDYDKEGCDYSISDLLRPPRMAQLERLHADEITEDASDRLWMLLGSAGHTVLERSAKKGIIEERAIVEVDGFKVGGKLDFGILDKTMWDYKFTSVWAANEGPKPEWEQQLNCYRYLAREYGVYFDKLVIVAIFRDWSKSKAAREPDFQQSQVKVMEVSFWPIDDVVTFISQRIAAHEAAKTILPQCTPEETWERPATYAVHKPGAKRALKLCSTLGAAREFITEQGRSLDIEVRPAERPRCADYCRCAPFCDQWKQFQSTNAVNSTTTTT